MAKEYLKKSGAYIWPFIVHRKKYEVKIQNLSCFIVTSLYV